VINSRIGAGRGEEGGAKRKADDKAGCPRLGDGTKGEEYPS